MNPFFQEVLLKCSLTLYALQDLPSGLPELHFPTSISHDNVVYLSGTHSLLNLWLDKIVGNVHYTAYSIARIHFCIQIQYVYLSLSLSSKGNKNEDGHTMPKMNIKLINVNNSR